MSDLYRVQATLHFRDGNTVNKTVTLDENVEAMDAEVAIYHVMGAQEKVHPHCYVKMVSVSAEPVATSYAPG